jgi:glycosyltransferase involved in cell wall biosynthesis
VISLVIPAHNEERVIGRLLSRLTTATDPHSPDTPPNPDKADLDLIVVCNGCVDATAEVAKRFPGVRVIETPEPSKRVALRLGDEAARGEFPRVYVDADVELGRGDVLALAAALADPSVLACSPGRVIPRTGVSRAVRWYYDVWEQLPHVRRGIFGRGVIALSEAGYQRIAALPMLMSDDLAMSSAFDEEERRVVDTAQVLVHPPRTWADLVRRRARAATGTTQAYAGPADLRTDSRTGKRDLIDLVLRNPPLAVKMPVFLAVAVLARRHAARAVRQGDYSTWLRDDSSREGAQP